MYQFKMHQVFYNHNFQISHIKIKAKMKSLIERYCIIFNHYPK